MKAALPTAFPTAGLAASRVRPLAHPLPSSRSRHRAPRMDPKSEPCGGETVIDFALCLILAVLAVGLLLLLAF